MCRTFTFGECPLQTDMQKKLTIIFSTLEPHYYTDFQVHGEIIVVTKQCYNEAIL